MWVKLSKMVLFQHFDLNMPSYRAFGGLSDGAKSIEY